MSTVADTILAQLGGRQFVRMTNPVLMKNATTLFIRLPARFAKDGIRQVQVTLTPDDLYTVAAFKAGRKITDEWTMIDEREGVPCDMLQEVFTDMTGLRCTLGVRRA